jgi:cation diffusion facilitator family transporter
LKIVVGIATGSLGILSEAAHSGLDLIAALVTFFSVRVSDKPADADHQYGHGKFENFSAFIETGLLLLTCVWIVYESIKRLFFHSVEIEPSHGCVSRDVVVDRRRCLALARSRTHCDEV